MEKQTFNGRDYIVENGTWYDAETSPEVIRVLEQCRANRTRVIIRAGQTEGHDVGRDWLEEYDTAGRIGRSCGTIKTPLLIHNSRSMGGGAILTRCIVRIVTAAGHRELYRHPAYKQPRFMLVEMQTPMEAGKRTLRWEARDLNRDGEVHARFETREQGERWAQRQAFEIVK